MRMNDIPLPPLAGCRAVPVTGRRGQRPFEASDWVAEEVPVALEYNGVSHAVMLASPADLEDFAVGFSLTEGIVGSRSDIRDIETSRSAQGITLHISMAPPCFAALKERRRSLTGRTGCGLCGTDSLASAVRPLPPLHSEARFDASAVLGAMAGLREQQPLLGLTGATHAAAWCDAQGQIKLLREDVGRHNALDKLIGALQRGELAAGSGFIVVTSRASYEMVHKSAVAGVALLAAVSGVTALAVEVAQSSGVTLLGFVRGADFSVYAHSRRLNLDFPDEA
ncbi:MAG: formate dehydrogenase accessory sulfurtransferase FdhD [Polaromonas sp.]|nr:formate dehydrogenase accessory sulfurtransferase FdhD [Polaromonas sp.]